MIKVICIFNTYGLGVMSNDGRVISNFIKQTKSEKYLTVYGDGSQTRSFCYVSNTVHALILVMASLFEITGPLNIERDEGISISTLAKLIINITGSRSKMKYLPLPKDDPKVRKPDTSLVKELLGWESTVSLKDGISKILSYDSKNIDIYIINVWQWKSALLRHKKYRFYACTKLTKLLGVASPLQRRL